MTTYDPNKAIEQAIYAMELHGMVVGKIIFSTGDEQRDFIEDFLELLPTNDWRWMDNSGTVIGFIIDKLTPDWKKLLTRIIQESERYIVKSWVIA